MLKRGVDVRAKDNFGRNALHYSVISGSLQLVKLLLSEDNGYNPNEVDNEGHTPLSLCLRGKNSEILYYNPYQEFDNIFMALVKKGADVNFVYPEDFYKPGFKEDEIMDLDNYDIKGKYKCSPMINLIRQGTVNEVMRNNLIGLIEYGAKLSVVDSDGRYPIMHAIITNNEMVVTILLENKKALNFDTKGRDKAGKTAVHYVVNPIRFGSYENVNILRLLHKYKFDLDIPDENGKTPAYYACD